MDNSNRRSAHICPARTDCEAKRERKREEGQEWQGKGDSTRLEPASESDVRPEP